jgi:hypothetical protein
VPVTLTLDFQGTGVGVVYRQDVWYGKLGVTLDDQDQYCIDQMGAAVRHQAEACFEVESGVTHTLVLTGDESTGVISGIVSVDAIRLYDTDEPCGAQGSLCDRGLVVPAYFEPGAPMIPAGAEDYWRRLAEAAKKLRERLIVVANVADGPGTAVVPTYTEAISAVVGNGGQVLGYVYTCFGNEVDPQRPYCPRPEGDIESDVDNWYEWYPIDGIFFDEVSLDQGKVSFYQGLDDYVQAKGRGELETVVLNFGAEPHEDYLNIGSSLLCTFEDPFPDFVGWLPPGCTAGWLPPEWLPRNRSCVLVYDTPEGHVPAAFQQLSRAENDWFYFTDDTMVDRNPWDTLPDYFEELVDTIYCPVYLPVVQRSGAEYEICQISVDPPTPIEGSAIEVTVFGEWYDSCVPQYNNHQVAEPVIEIDLVRDYPPDVLCLQVITPWEAHVEIGPLTSGDYQVRAHIDRVQCSSSSFTVVRR